MTLPPDAGGDLAGGWMVIAKIDMADMREE